MIEGICRLGVIRGTYTEHFILCIGSQPQMPRPRKREWMRPSSSVILLRKLGMASIGIVSSFPSVVPFLAYLEQRLGISRAMVPNPNIRVRFLSLSFLLRADSL